MRRCRRKENDIEQWWNECLEPIFQFVGDQLKDVNNSNFYSYFFISFKKNSMPIFENLEYMSASYPIAQSLRLLMELTADLDFINEHPENLNHLQKEADKYLKKAQEKKLSWRECIISSGDIKLRVGSTDITDEKLVKQYSTKKRVEKVFGEKLYSFYSSFSHVNLFAICDDAWTIKDKQALLLRRAECMKEYPNILAKFLLVLGAAMKKDLVSDIDFKKFYKDFDVLLSAIVNAEVINE